MLDIKNWLETTDINTADTAFKKKTELPYIVFLEDTSTNGSDDTNLMALRDVNVEFYSSKISRTNEKKIESLLDDKGFEYKKSRIWLEDEKCFQTIYDFSFLERKDD